MQDHLEEQLVNELRALLRELNKKYQDFFHFQLITLCDLKDDICKTCQDNETKPRCLRVAVGIHEHGEHWE